MTPMPPPLSDADRYMSVIRIMLEALTTLMDDPQTEMSEEAADAFSAELQVAKALLGAPPPP